MQDTRYFGFPSTLLSWCCALEQQQQLLHLLTIPLLGIALRSPQGKCKEGIGPEHPSGFGMQLQGAEHLLLSPEAQPARVGNGSPSAALVTEPARLCSQPAAVPCPQQELLS